MIRSVLMVCEGNICRSPMAAALLARELPHLAVSSAGTHALVGEPANAVVAEQARANGIPIDTHVATQIDIARVNEADLILTMTQAQREWVEAAWPSARGKVFRLCDEQRMDVIDPYRRHRAVFDLTFVQIRQGIADWTRTLAVQQ
ncbi:protein tyrosine phosphatase [Caballeronia peredens]|nr:protein tyrosine phosphatase [Caballeronia peredens]